MSRSVSAPSSVTNTSPCWNGDIVPGSTLMYGSSLRLVTRTPLEVRMAASDAAAMPFPNEETTPPVTNTNLVIGWPVPEIGILPERMHRSKRIACAAQCAAAHCGTGATVRPTPLTDPSARQPLPLQSLFHPLTGRIAAHQFEDRVDCRCLQRPCNERAQRHHNLRRLDSVPRGGGLDRVAERLAFPGHRYEFAVQLGKCAAVEIGDLRGEHRRIDAGRFVEIARRLGHPGQR